VLGLEVWDRLLERAKTDRASLERIGHRLADELARSGAELERLPDLGGAVGPPAAGRAGAGCSRRGRGLQDEAAARADSRRARRRRRRLRSATSSRAASAPRRRWRIESGSSRQTPWSCRRRAERLQVTTRANRCRRSRPSLSEAAAYAEEYGRWQGAGV
jgi:hypothetical protein